MREAVEIEGGCSIVKTVPANLQNVSEKMFFIEYLCYFVYISFSFGRKVRMYLWTGRKRPPTLSFLRLGLTM